MKPFKAFNIEPVVIRTDFSTHQQHLKTWFEKNYNCEIFHIIQNVNSYTEPVGVTHPKNITEIITTIFFKRPTWDILPDPPETETPTGE